MPYVTEIPAGLISVADGNLSFNGPADLSDMIDRSADVGQYKIDADGASSLSSGDNFTFIAPDPSSNLECTYLGAGTLNFAPMRSILTGWISRSPFLRSAVIWLRPTVNTTSSPMARLTTTMLRRPSRVRSAPRRGILSRFRSGRFRCRNWLTLWPMILTGLRRVGPIDWPQMCGNSTTSSWATDAPRIRR